MAKPSTFAGYANRYTTECEEPHLREARALRQRTVSAAVERLLAVIG